MLETTVGGLYLPLVTRASQSLRHAESIIELFIRDPLTYQDSPTRGAAKFLELLCEIDRCNKAEKKTAAPSDVLYVKRAKKYVQSNIRRPITQREVAEHLSITPEYLCAVFKKNEGITFKRYVNTEKLEAIRLLMRTEHMRLCDASAAFGYSDPNYVSRLFKKYYEYNITEIKKRRI
jgi:AraC-like DNA-binding protein